MESALKVIMIVVVWILIIGTWIIWKRLTPSYSTSVIVATKEARRELLKYYSDSKPNTKPIITVLDQHLPNLQSHAVQKLFVGAVIQISLGYYAKDKMRKFLNKTSWVKYK